MIEPVLGEEMASIPVLASQRELFQSSIRYGRKVAAQVELLEGCISAGTRLSEALRLKGLEYDDLIYQKSTPVLLSKTRYFKLDDFAQRRSHLPVVSFFSGAGGVDLGFEVAGFEHLALVEHNPVFCETIRRNRPTWTVIGPPDSAGDVSEIEELSSSLRPLIGQSKAGFDGVFVGGPPCQPFSIAANQRFSKSGKNFKRVGFAHRENGNLLFDFIELIERFKPRAFLIENVPGLFDVDNGAQLRKAIARLGAAGYVVEQPFVLNAANFLIPQQRLRMFIVGARCKKEFKKPEPRGTSVACARALERINSSVPNHETREHEAESVLRYMKLDYGQRDQLGRVDRLHPSLPSKTVIAGGTAGGGRSHLHPYIPRTLSVRECARLQTFPDDYVFSGPPARQFTQVGNAVPPVLAAQLARAIRVSYF